MRHSEYNHEDVETRIFQIWIIPTRTGDEPAWGSKPFPKRDRSGQFITLASGFEEDGDALPIRPDARVLGATLKAGTTLESPLGNERAGSIVPDPGAVRIDDVGLTARDGGAHSAGRSGARGGRKGG